MTSAATEARPSAIPNAARWGFTLWMVFWVSVILWAHGPQNFFWLCNLAQFLILFAIWTGHRLILSSQAGLVVAVGLGWTLDYVSALLLSGSVTGFTAYMFDPRIPVLARATSFYHILVPPFVLWLCYRVGYDRRGWILQCGIGAGAVLASWLVTEPERNINWVFSPFGLEDVRMPHPIYVGLLLILYPIVLYLPGHGLVQASLAFLQRRRHPATKA